MGTWVHVRMFVLMSKINVQNRKPNRDAQSFEVWHVNGGHHTRRSAAGVVVVAPFKPGRTAPAAEPFFKYCNKELPSH